jgi:hypothetical protein
VSLCRQGGTCTDLHVVGSIDDPSAARPCDKYEAAAKEFREWLEQQPDLEMARDHVAKALRAEGRLQEAEQVLTGPPIEIQ